MWFWWLPKFGNTDVVSLFLNIVGDREPIPLKALYSTLHGYSYWGKAYFLLDLTSTPWRPHRTFQISFLHDNSSDICRQLSCPSWAFSFGQKNHILSWLLKKCGWIDSSNLISGNTELQDLQLLFDTKGQEEWGCWDSRRQEILNERQGYTFTPEDGFCPLHAGNQRLLKFLAHLIYSIPYKKPWLRCQPRPSVGSMGLYIAKNSLWLIKVTVFNTSKNVKKNICLSQIAWRLQQIFSKEFTWPRAHLGCIQFHLDSNSHFSH